MNLKSDLKFPKFHTLKKADLLVMAIIVAQALTIADVPAYILQPLHLTFAKEMLYVGLLDAAYQVPSSIWQFVAAKVTKRFKPRNVLLVLLPVISSVYILYPLSHSFWAFFMVRVLNGLLFGQVLNAFVVFLRERVQSADPEIQAKWHGFSFALNTFSAGYFAGLGLEVNSTVLWSSAMAMGWISTALVYWITGFRFHMRRRWMRRKTKKLLFHSLLHLDWNTLILVFTDLLISTIYWIFLAYFAVYRGGSSASLPLRLSMWVNGACALFVMPKLLKKQFWQVMGGCIFLLMMSFTLISMHAGLLPGVLIGIGMAGTSLGILERVNLQAKTEDREKVNATASLAKQLGAVLGPLLAGLIKAVVGGDLMWVASIPFLLIAFVWLFFVVKPGRFQGRFSSILVLTWLDEDYYVQNLIEVNNTAYSLAWLELGRTEGQLNLQELIDLHRQLLFIILRMVEKNRLQDKLKIDDLTWGSDESVGQFAQKLIRHKQATSHQFDEERSRLERSRLVRILRDLKDNPREYRRIDVSAEQEHILDTWGFDPSELLKKPRLWSGPAPGTTSADKRPTDSGLPVNPWRVD